MSARVIHYQPEKEYWFREGCHILEIANHPEDPAVSIARARLEPGMHTRWHALHNTWERYLIVQGNGMVEIGKLEPTEVGPGDVVRIPPGTRQRIRNSGAGDLIFYAICSPRFTPDCYQPIDD